MTRSARLFWLALAGSLLLHASLLGSLDWTLPQWQDALEPAPIEARLMPPPVAPPPKARPPAPPRRPRPAPPPAPVAAPVVPAAVAEVPEAEESVALVAPRDEPVVAAAAPAEPAADTETAPPPLNPLPPRIDLHFELRYGLARGEQTLLWVNQGERYTITSVAAATGLTGVFYSGHFVQTSSGRITPRGLQPEEFWDQRGDKRSSARFDAANATLTLNRAKGAPRHFALHDEVQDVLSLFFQLALTAPPSGGQLTYTVFNGKKLRSYTYEVRGEETLETEVGTLRTLHLARRTGSDGRFEVWLAIDRHYLPVRILRTEESGFDGELVIRSIDEGN